MSISYKANVGVEEGFQFGRAFALSWRTPGYYVTQFGLRSSHNRLRGDQPCHVVQDAQGAGREQVIPDGGAGLDAAPLPRPRRPAWEDRKPGSVTNYCQVGRGTFLVFAVIFQVSFRDPYTAQDFYFEEPNRVQKPVSVHLQKTFVN